MMNAVQLPSLHIGAVTHTVTLIEAEAVLASTIQACPKCGGKVESKGLASAASVWDTPTIGKHMLYRFQGRRYRCPTPGCQSFTYRGPDVHPKHGMTWRLWHYVQALALKRSIKDIVRLTGATEDQVWPAIQDLAKALDGHRFPTPRVVAIDDIRFGKKRRFTVISDAESGHPLAIVEKLDAKGVGKKLHEVIDPQLAKIYVSDMNGSNIALGESSFAGIPHVADKWHVLDKMQRQMSRVVNQTSNKLSKGPAAELKSWKKELEGKFAAEDAKELKAQRSGKKVPARQRHDSAQPGLKLTTKWDILKDPAHAPVRQVFHARLLLRNVYRASGRRQAEVRFDRFIQFGMGSDMPEEAAKAVELLGKHRKLILAYFDHMWQHHDKRFRGATTSMAEARNSKIKTMWKGSRGIRNAAYLNLRVVFEPYVLGVTLTICQACGAREVLREDQGLLRAGMSILDPRVRLCSACC